MPNVQKFLDAAGTSFLWNKIITELNKKANNIDLTAVATSGDYTDLINKPTNVSAFTNDAGYLTQHQDISGKADISELQKIPFTQVYAYGNTEIQVNDAKTLTFEAYGQSPISYGYWYSHPYIILIDFHDGDMNIFEFYLAYITAEYKLRLEQLGGNKVFESEYIPSLANIWDSPSIVYYKGEINKETDPTVPAWAKTQNKPSYTAAEVGATTVQDVNTMIATAIANKINNSQIATVFETLAIINEYNEEDEDMLIEATYTQPIDGNPYFITTENADDIVNAYKSGKHIVARLKYVNAAETFGIFDDIYTSMIGYEPGYSDGGETRLESFNFANVNCAIRTTYEAEGIGLIDKVYKNNDGKLVFEIYVD